MLEYLGYLASVVVLVSLLMSSKPSIDCCPLTAMGFIDNTGFPDINTSLVM